MLRAPDVPAEILRQLRGAARAYEKAPDELQEPPWSLTDRRYEDPEDDAVVGAVFAAHVVPSQRGSDEPWLIRGLLRLNSRGRVVLASVAVEHLFDPDQEVTATVLRRLPLGGIRDHALSYLRLGPTVEAILGRTENAAPTRAEMRRVERIAEAAAPLRRGRIGYPREHYRRIALRALELSKNGRRDVLKQLVEAESRTAGRPIPYQTVRDWVARARKEQFLAPTDRGHSTWLPGPKLYALEEEER